MNRMKSRESTLEYQIDDAPCHIDLILHSARTSGIFVNSCVLPNFSHHAAALPHNHAFEPGMIEGAGQTRIAVECDCKMISH